MVPDDHPCCFGLALRPLNQAARLYQEADVVLLLGKKLDFTVAFGGLPAFSPEAKLIQIDPSVAEIGRNREVDVGLVGDVGPVLDQLTQVCASRPWPELPWLTH